MDKFIPEIWAGETQKLLQESLKLEKPIYSTVIDYSNITRNAQAGGYNGPVLTGNVAIPLPISDDDFKVLTQGNFNMPFDQNIGVPVLIKDIEAAQSIIAMRETYTSGAKIALEDGYNSYLIKQMVDGTASGNRQMLADSVNNVLTKADFVNAHKFLNKAKAPRRNRYCVLGADLEAQIYDIAGFISRDKIANTNALSDATIGKLMGFEVMLAPDMPVVDSDGYVDATAEINVALFYHRTCAGFGRNKELGSREESKAGLPGVMINTFSAFGAKVHPSTLGTRIVSIREHAESPAS